MPRALLLSFLLLLTICSTAQAADFAPDRVVVGFATGADAAERADARQDVGAALIGTVSGPREQVLRVDGDPEEIAADLERRPEVAYAEPDFIVRAQWTPNDSLLGAQWALGQTAVPRAWDAARGAGTLVGIVDTGISFTHPDLGRHDPRGLDFVNRDADPSDDNGHGTGVAGVVAATAGNGAGIAGVAPEASVIAAKALDSQGSGYSSAVADGADHLADLGARVVNLSLGGGGRSSLIASAIDGHPGTLFVIAAGNAGIDNDAGAGTWPCNEPGANVICVGAGTRSDGRADFSNYGAVSVDLMAPGADIATTWIGGGYASLNGTSFSAPMVAGAAALLYGHRPDASVADVRSALLSSADAVAGYAGITVTGGRLNAERALTNLNPAALPAAEPPAPAPAPAAVPPTVAPLPVQAPHRPNCTVPAVRRLTSAQARRKLEAAGCRVGTVRRQYSRAVRKGRIVSSSPRSGASARAVISMYLSRGPRS